MTCDASTGGSSRLRRPSRKAAAACALLTRGDASDVRATRETFFTVVLYAFWRGAANAGGMRRARALVCSSAKRGIHFNDRNERACACILRARDLC